MSLELLSLGADFVGGLMNRSAQKKADRQNQLNWEKQFAASQKQFDAQMDQSVQRRVADAKKAGIHPLFAMGASVGTSPTLSASGAPRASGHSSMGNAISKMASTLGVIEQNRASAKRDEAEAALMDSERARIEQDAASQGRDTALKSDGTIAGPLAAMEAPKTPTAPRGVELNEEGKPYPARISVVDEMGNEYTLPNPELGMEEVGQLEYIMGAPARIIGNFRKVGKAEAEQKTLERELNRLRAIRQNPEKEQEYHALKADVKERVHRVYKWFKGLKLPDTRIFVRGK